MTIGGRLSRVRSTPLRLTVILLLIFTVASLGCFATAYLVVRANLNAAILFDIRQSVDSFQRVTSRDDLRKRLTETIATTDPAFRVLRYLSDRGAGHVERR